MENIVDQKIAAARRMVLRTDLNKDEHQLWVERLNALFYWREKLAA